MPFNSVTGKIAGAKTKRGLSERTKLLNDLFDETKAKKIFKQLQDKAVDGDLESIKLYMAYCFGRPKESMDITSDGEKIGGYRVEVIRSHANAETAN